MKPRSPATILRQADSKAIIITDLVNIRYLTGVNISYGILLVTSRAYHLFLDDRYMEEAAGASGGSVRIHKIETLEKFLMECRECGFESDKVTVEKYRKWKGKYKNTKFVRRKGVIEEFRRQKDDRELKRFRRAQRITGELLRRVPAALRSYPTEKSLAWRLENWARELGADGLAFEPIVAFGNHTSHPHHHVTDRKLKKGHIVQIDVGARYKGYCSDRSEVFFTAQPTSLQQKVLCAVEEAKEVALEKVRAVVTTHALDRAARKILKKHGFEKYFTHALGHGVGLEIHEGVSLSQKVPCKKILKNEIITIEPGVYLPGKFGIRLEEEVVV